MCNAGDRLLHPQGQLQVLDLRAVSSEGEGSGPPDDRRSTCGSGSLPGPALAEPVLWAGCDLSAGLSGEKLPRAHVLSPDKDPKAVLAMCWDGGCRCGGGGQGVRSNLGQVGNLSWASRGLGRFPGSGKRPLESLKRSCAC